MSDKTVAAPLHDNLRDLIGQAISDEIAAGAEQPDWCDSREIDRLANAVMAVLDEAAKTGATVAEVPGGGLVFINRGEQLEDWADLNCPACGGSGHADDARDARAVPAGADDVFAAFCDREGYPSDGEIDVMLRAAFDEGLRSAASQPPADAAPVDAKPVAWSYEVEHGGEWLAALHHHAPLEANNIRNIRPLTYAQPSAAQGDPLKCGTTRAERDAQRATNQGGERDAALPLTVVAWYVAEKARIEAVGKYNGKLAAAKEYGFPGPDVSGEFKVMTDTGNAAHRLLRPMYEAIAAMAKQQAQEGGAA